MGATEGFQKNSNFENFQGSLHSIKTINFGAFQGPMAQATWA